MKKYTFITVGFLLIIFIIGFFITKEDYSDLKGIERLLIKNNVSFTSKPVELENQLKFAKAQRIYEVENNNIYVYIVEKSDMEKADSLISNELLDKEYIVSTTDTVLFAYTDTNLERFQKSLFKVIDEIKKTEN